MGVFEGWRWVIVTFRRGGKLPIASQAESHDQKYFLAGANVATCFFLLLFLCAFINQKVSASFMVATAVVLMLAVAVWFFLRNTPRWPRQLGDEVAVLFGLLLPILLIAEARGYLPDVPPPVGWPMAVGDQFAFLGIGVACMLLFHRSDDLFMALTRSPHQLRFCHSTNCLPLVMGFCGVLLSALSLGAMVAIAVNGGSDQATMRRICTVEMAYICVGVAAFIMWLLIKPRAKDGDEGGVESGGVVPSDLGRQDGPARGRPYQHFGVAIRGLVLSGRPVTAGIAGALVAIVVLQHRAGGLLIAAAQAAPMVLVTMVGFIANDIFDVDADRVARKRRPLVLGQVSERVMRSGAGILGVLALALAATVAPGRAIAVLAMALFAVLLYSPFARHVGWVKNLYTAALCLAPLYYGAAIVDWIPPRQAVVLIVVFVTGRELLLDVRDYEGDIACRKRTIAILLGKRIALVIAWLLMGVPAVTTAFIGEGLDRYLAMAAAIAIAGTALLNPMGKIGLRVTKIIMLVGCLIVAG